MEFLFLFLIPLLIPAVVFIAKREISLKELAIHCGIQALLAGVLVGLLFISSTSDWEIWNGIVTKKEKETVSCEHSYDCNCREECSGSGENKSCSTVCDTCYRHWEDYDWTYYTTDGGRNTIDRIDDQGAYKPARWERIIIGEPSVSSHMFTNYVKAAADSLFKAQGQKEQFAKLLKSVTYPNKIYDYYRIDRVVPIGIVLPKKKDMEVELSKINSQLGKRKQVNMIIVIVNSVSPDFFYALEEHWLGGKKNDVILVVGVGQEETTVKIQWVNTMAWTDSEYFKIMLRDAVLALKELDLEDPTQVTSVLASTVGEHYKRKPMADFAYLKDSIQPSTTQIAVALLFGLLASAGMTWFFYKHEI